MPCLHVYTYIFTCDIYAHSGYKTCICYIYLKCLFWIYFVVGFFCLFKPLTKFWHSRFLFSGVQGQVMKDVFSIQNAFMGINKRRKTTLQKKKKKASIACPSVSHQEFLANTMHMFVAGLCQAFHSLQIRTCTYTCPCTQLVSVDTVITIMTRADLDACLVRRLMGQAVAWRAVFWYAECVIAGLSDVKRWLCFVTGSGEQLGKSSSLPFPLLKILKQVIPRILPCKTLQMRIIWKSKIETRALPLVF